MVKKKQVNGTKIEAEHARTALYDCCSGSRSRIAASDFWSALPNTFYLLFIIIIVIIILLFRNAVPFKMFVVCYQACISRDVP